MSDPSEDDDYFDMLNDEDDGGYECDHVDAEIGWEGRAVCICGHSWRATLEQIEAQDRHMREYAEWEAEQHRHDKAWWRRLGRWLATLIPRRASTNELPF